MKRRRCMSWNHIMRVRLWKQWRSVGKEMKMLLNHNINPRVHQKVYMNSRKSIPTIWDKI
jgi:hypothetical protein